LGSWLGQMTQPDKKSQLIAGWAKRSNWERNGK